MKINTTCLDCTWILFCQNQNNVHLIANFPFPWLENHIHLHIQLQICVFFSLSISLYGHFLLWRICKHPEEKHKKLFKIESSSNSKVDDRSDEHSKWHHFLLWKDNSLEIKNLTKILPIAVSIVREPTFGSFLWEMVLAFTLSFFCCGPLHFIFFQSRIIFLLLLPEKLHGSEKLGKGNQLAEDLPIVDHLDDEDAYLIFVTNATNIFV